MIMLYSNAIEWQRLVFYYYAAFYILVQSEKEYSLIWKAKPLTTQTNQKDKK